MSKRPTKAQKRPKVPSAPKNTKARREEMRDEQSTLVRNAELFYDTGLSLPTRTIFLSSETFDSEGNEAGCDSRMAEVFIKNMHVLETVDREADITVIMNNIGGDEYHGLAIFDAIKQSPCDVIVVVRGHAMSMGSVILQAADKRVMGPNATQMIHYGTWGTHTHAKTAEKQMQEGIRLNAHMEEMYLKRIQEKKPGYTLAELKDQLDHDSFFTAQQSIDFGLADEIG